MAREYKVIDNIMRDSTIPIDRSGCIVTEDLGAEVVYSFDSDSDVYLTIEYQAFGTKDLIELRNLIDAFIEYQKKHKRDV